MRRNMSENLGLSNTFGQAVYLYAYSLISLISSDDT